MVHFSSNGSPQHRRGISSGAKLRALHRNSARKIRDYAPTYDASARLSHYAPTYDASDEEYAQLSVLYVRSPASPLSLFPRGRQEDQTSQTC
eukprot:2994572-Amphidinium_carterae.1